MSQLFELRIVASGEVRDADGNLLNAEPIEATAVLTEEEVVALIKQEEKEA
jgi:hypothetical protein